MAGSLTIPNVVNTQPGPTIQGSLLDANWSTIAAYVNAREVSSGALASRPTAGTAGRWYYATDAATLYFDTGVGWQAATQASAGNTPEQFGAVGDGTTDDTAAVQAAINTGYCRLLAKTYHITATLTLPISSDCTIVGAGIGLSILKFTAATGAAVSGSFSDIAVKVTLQDFSVLSAFSASSTVGVSLTWPVVASNVDPTATISGLGIGPFTPGTDFFVGGLYLSGAWNTTIRASAIRGRDSDTTATAWCILLDGHSTDVSISACHFDFATVAVQITGTCEGTLITDCWMIFVTYGVLASTIDAADHPLLNVVSCHIAAFAFGIDVVNKSQSAFIGNLIYKRQDSSLSFTGILVTASGYTRITDNHIVEVGGATGVVNGIEIVTGDTHIIIGNSCQNMDEFINVQATASNATVIGNRASGSGTIANSGAGTAVTANNVAI